MKYESEQRICVHCLHEQYALNVKEFSAGEASCTWCGQMSRKMSTDDYQQALLERRIEMGQADRDG